MLRKLSVKLRVFLGVAACAVILVVWQLVAPPPPSTTTEVEDPTGLVESTDGVEPTDLQPADGDLADVGPEAPLPTMRIGPYEFPRVYLFTAIWLLVQLVVGAVIVSLVVRRRRTVKCRSCQKRIRRDAVVCAHCGREQQERDPDRGGSPLRS
jgi:hypothetical protein